MSVTSSNLQTNTVNFVFTDGNDVYSVLKHTKQQMLFPKVIFRPCHYHTARKLSLRMKPPSTLFAILPPYAPTASIYQNALSTGARRPFGRTHSEHCFPAPSSKRRQIWLRHLRGTLHLRAAVHRRGQRPPKGFGTDKTVEATKLPSTHVNMSHPPRVKIKIK